MYSEEGAQITEILGKMLLFFVNQAENRCNVVVKVENWRRSQNLLALQKIKFFH